MSDLTDDELMILFCDGDADAFDVLFTRHCSSVQNFASAMLSDATRAEDILQDTFLAVARSGKTYEPRGQFRTWLMRIVRNRCLNAIESERVRRAAIARTGFEIIDPPSSDPTGPEQLEMDDLMATVSRNIADLPERQREAIVLRAFEQMSYRQIGEVLDLPENTVKTLIHRARAALAKAMENGQEEKTDGM